MKNLIGALVVLLVVAGAISAAPSKLHGSKQGGTKDQSVTSPQSAQTDMKAAPATDSTKSTKMAPTKHKRLPKSAVAKKYTSKKVYHGKGSVDEAKRGMKEKKEPAAAPDTSKMK